MTAEPSEPAATTTETTAPADAPSAAAAEPTAPEAASASDASDSDEGESHDAELDDDADAPADGPDSDDDAADADDPPAAEPHDDGAAQATAAQLGVTLDDLPPEARPLVEKRLREINAGFTKGRQKDREEITALKSEIRFQQERPADYVVSLLRSNPQLAEQVNAKLDELEGSPTAREAHDIVVQSARAKALESESSVLAQDAAKARRAEEIESSARQAAQRAGVPFTMGVEEGVALHLVQHGEITPGEISEIVEEKKRAYDASMRAVRREQSKRLAKEKVTDRKTAGLKAKPGAGTAPAPLAKPAPKTRDEFIDYMVATL